LTRALASWLLKTKIMEHATTLNSNFFSMSELPDLKDSFCIDTSVSLYERTTSSERGNFFDASTGNFASLPIALNSIRQLVRLPSAHALRKGHWTLTVISTSRVCAAPAGYTSFLRFPQMLLR
jgi:hypothetical protein